MKQVIIKKGTVFVEESPAPQVSRGSVLVKVVNSCISIGTEMSGVRSSGMPLWKRAMKQPENLKKGLDMIQDQGVVRTWETIQGKLEAGNATGYSATGEVIEVGEGIDDIKPGDKVACAGAQCANHAEIINVPRNLCVKVPDTVSSEAASTVTLGAIAMQGVRRAKPTLGETFVVIGLGILGQITVQLLKANGVRVIGMDLDQDRIDQAMGFGMDMALDSSGAQQAIQQVERLTDGNGADGVIITAATSSDEVISQAFKMCRKKARVVLVGDVGLNLNRGDFYQKEIDFFISTSYGPGRYDNLYEEKGMEYPIGYVRWTENRNMLEYIRLIGEGKVAVGQMIEKRFPLNQAQEAYNELKEGTSKPLMVILDYPDTEVEKKLNRKVENPRFKSPKDKILNIGLIGAGGFAKGMHLPNIMKLSDLYKLYGVASKTGHNASSVATQFGAKYSTTDINELLSDSNIDVVFITTRHNLHTHQALQALKAGKHVLLEKPLAMSQDELNEIKAFYDQATDAPILLTGFNRRFSSYAERIKNALNKKVGPVIINYTMNAGYIPLDHWVHNEEGGGRNIGEACHIYDLFTYLVDSEVESVSAHSIKSKTEYYGSDDNFTATVSFKDGSVCNLIYTALGSKQYPKEQMQVFFDGQVAFMDNYRSLKFYGSKHPEYTTRNIEKGQFEEIKYLAEAIQKTGDWPIPLWQQLQATDISFKIQEQLKG